MTGLFSTLLALSLGGGALTALLLGLHRAVGGRLPSGFWYGAWLLALLRFVLPVPGLLPVSAVKAPPVETAPGLTLQAEYSGEDRSYPVFGASARQETPPPEQQTWAADGGSAAMDGTRFPESEISPDVSGETVPGGDGFFTKQMAWSEWIADLWLTGAALWTVWHLVGYQKFRREVFRTVRPAGKEASELRMALYPLPYPALYRSAAVQTPLLMGLVRPVILLPDREYTPEMLQGILRHELTHYRRGDLAAKWFATAVTALHWFNPLVHLARVELDRCCELSCDAVLLRTMDRDEKQRYGELLLTLAAERPLPRRLAIMPIASEKRNLKERLTQIMMFHKFKTGKAGALCVLLAALLLAGCAGVLGPGAAVIPVEQTEDSSSQGDTLTEDLAVHQSGGQAATTDNPADTGGVDGLLPVPTDAPWGYALTTQDGAELRDRYQVSTVDEFLAALGSDRVIFLNPGEYNLTQAEDYGNAPQRAPYSWEAVPDGYALRVFDLENLSILGIGGSNAVSLVTVPRYADVLGFTGCETITLAHITAGHTIAQGVCSGGVLDFQNADNITIDACDLYGCGTLGIRATNCRGVFANGTTIRECSNGAIEATNCYDLRFTGGVIRDCGQKSEDAPCYTLLAANTTTGFAVINTKISNNHATRFLSSSNSLDTALYGCLVTDNRFGDAICTQGAAVTIDGTGFSRNAVSAWAVNPENADVNAASDEPLVTARPLGPEETLVVDASGAALSPEALEAMTAVEYTGDYNGPSVPMELTPPEGTENADGLMEYHVSTVDDFLAAIGSHTVIYLEGETFDLSTATNYGGYGSRWFFWENDYDGPGLVITGAEDLHIIGQGKDRTTIEALPRYADVIAFHDCNLISVENLTAGHTRGAGACSGDVLSFQDSELISISGCGLFGCGVNGIRVLNSQFLTVQDTEIYECSQYGAELFDSDSVSFEDCSIHDCGYNSILGRNCALLTWNGLTPAEAGDVFQLMD